MSTLLFQKVANMEYYLLDDLHLPEKLDQSQQIFPTDLKAKYEQGKFLFQLALQHYHDAFHTFLQKAFMYFKTAYRIGCSTGNGVLRRALKAQTLKCSCNAARFRFAKILERNMMFARTHCSKCSCGLFEFTPRNNTILNIGLRSMVCPDVLEDIL